MEAATWDVAMREKADVFWVSLRPLGDVSAGDATRDVVRLAGAAARAAPVLTCVPDC